MALEQLCLRDVLGEGPKDAAVASWQHHIASRQLCVAANLHQVNLFHCVAATDASLTIEEVVEDEVPDVSLMLGELLQVDGDLQS